MLCWDAAESQIPAPISSDRTRALARSLGTLRPVPRPGSPPPAPSSWSRSGPSKCPPNALSCLSTSATRLLRCSHSLAAHGSRWLPSTSRSHAEASPRPARAGCPSTPRRSCSRERRYVFCPAWCPRRTGERWEAEHTGQIVAIGRNYAEHIKELSNDAPKEPMFFLKPTTSYLPSGGNVEIPRGVTAHYEGAFSSVVYHVCL